MKMIKNKSNKRAGTRIPVDQLKNVYSPSCPYLVIFVLSLNLKFNCGDTLKYWILERPVDLEKNPATSS